MHSTSTRTFLESTLTSPHSKATLLLDAFAVTPGSSFRAGLQLQLDKGWHTYWKNPGDSGTEVRLTWTLPEGMTAEPLQWPVPERIETQGLVSYAYSNTVVFPARLWVSSTVPVNSQQMLRARANWLVCEEVCLPAEASFEIPIRIASSHVAAPTDIQNIFDAAQKTLPTPWPKGTARVTETPDHFTLFLADGATSLLNFRMFFPDPGVPVSYALPHLEERLNPAGLPALSLKFEKSTTAPAFEPNSTPAPLSGLLITSQGAYEVAPSHFQASEQASQTTTPLLPANPHLTGDLALMSAFALGGGVLLNLMPCVFPMLAVKLLGLINSTQKTATAFRKAGLFYTLGVLVSMWTLASGLLAFRASGRALGWGFQLQSPLFVATLALLFFVMGFVFLGKLTLNAPSRLLPAKLLSKQGNTGEFFAGVLSTIVATPCSAPFMATAIGYALAQPLHMVWVVFTALGVGLALPFLGLSWFPGLVRVMPRPGKWMVVLKELLAFPLFASAVWLVWVFAQQTSLESVATLLLACVALGAAGWVAQSGHFSKGIAQSVGSLLALGALAGVVTQVNTSSTSPLQATEQGSASKAGTSASSKNAFTWIPFEPGLPERLAAQGKIVFVDYTASWCLTCKVNERVVFGSQAVQNTLAQKGNNVTLVRADWTNEDDAIGKSLAQFGRSGVPLYLMYSPQKTSSTNPTSPAPAAASPEILPQLLTPGLFLAALERAAASSPP